MGRSKKQPGSQTRMEIASRLFRKHCNKKERREIVKMFVKYMGNYKQNGAKAWIR